MKALIERLAAGNCTFDTPSALISENKIDIEIFSDDVYHGEISVVGKDNKPVTGVVFSTDNHLIIDNNSFEGVNNTIKYTVVGTNLLVGQVVTGTVSIVTTGGDYAIPFIITIKSRKIMTAIGEIENLEAFVELVKRNYDEALILFLSKEFRSVFLKDDHARTLYEQVMENSNRNIALEEFLVGMGLKNKVTISIEKNIKEYTNLDENYGDSFNIIKSGWGYVDIEVDVYGEFLYNCKTHITGDDFNGKICEYSYYINAAKLHGGSNNASITFNTSYQSKEFDIVIVNKKENLDDYISEKKNSFELVKKYLDFRTGLIDGKQWARQTADLSDDRLKNNNEEVVGMLLRTQAAIVENDNEKASEMFLKLSPYIPDLKKRYKDEYSYYLYLQSLYKKDEAFTSEVLKEIKEIFENGHDSWQVLWILFYMDDRYNQNPSLKYTMIKRMFNNGCHSPMMYYEAANVIVEQPEILRVVNQFEIQVLNFIGKYHMTNMDVADQAAEVIEKDRSYEKKYLNILRRFYDDTKSLAVLESICQIIINVGQIEKEYFEYLKEGVARELNITNLYEYYIYAKDINDFEPLEKAAYRYFYYGTDTLIYNKDYFYANVIKNKDSILEHYDKYLDYIKEYAKEEILKGNNNKYLRIIYNEILDDDFITDDMKKELQKVLHTVKIKVNNPNIKSVILSHKELEASQAESLDMYHEAYLNIYTNDYVLTFVDKDGRVLSDVEYELEDMTIDAKISGIEDTIYTTLLKAETIMKDPEKNTGQMKILKTVVESGVISHTYKNNLKEFIVDYYYNSYDEDDTELYILNFNMAQLSQMSRNKVIEILIFKRMYDQAFNNIVKYGYESIEKSFLIELCENMVATNEHYDNDIFVEMCAEAFRNGCRDEKLLKFIGERYETGTIEMYQIFLAIKSKNLNFNTLSQRLLAQMMFENSVEDKFYVVYDEYVKHPSDSKVRKAFYTYIAYNYFIKKVHCPKHIWEYLEEEYENGMNTPMITMIAFTEIMSKREELSEKQVGICEKLVYELTDNNIYFEFFKLFNKWFTIPYSLVDKTIIDYRTNPKHRVEITYEIFTDDGNTKEFTEEMGSIYPGVFTKEVIMFYGEEISYAIREFGDDDLEGKVVSNLSVKITEKDIYNEANRFGMINGMMIAKSMEDHDLAREKMQNYELCKVAGKELFRLL